MCTPINTGRIFEICHCRENAFSIFLLTLLKSLCKYPCWSSNLKQTRITCFALWTSRVFFYCLLQRGISFYYPWIPSHIQINSFQNIVSAGRETLSKQIFNHGCIKQNKWKLWFSSADAEPEGWPGWQVALFAPGWFGLSPNINEL